MRYLEDQQGHTYNLPTNTTNILGRKSDSDIPVPPLEDDDFDEIYYDVSRHHLKITSDVDQCTLEDMHSSNGTKIDGETVEPGTSYEIKEGNKIELGRVTLTFHDTKVKHQET